MYQEIFGDVEDFAQELKLSKAKKAWFRINTEQAEVEAVRPVRLEDGTTSQEKARGVKFVAKITVTSLGHYNPAELESKALGSSTHFPKPDTQMVFTATLAEKDCFSNEDVALFDKEVAAGWKGVLSEMKKIWDGAVFEGVGSILG